MGKGSGAGGSDDEPDERIAWLMNKVMMSMKVKQKNWDSMVKSDELR
jgi:hypothetical protein